MRDWIVVANFGSGLDADIAAADLRAQGIPARVRGNDIVGIVGPGFQGTTARGVDVLVPASSADEARAILADDDAG